MQEVCCFLVCVGCGVSLALGRTPIGFLPQAYLTAVGILYLNHVRTLGAHRYLNSGEEEMTFVEQLLDSMTYPDAWLFGEIAMPVGLRYHALHHSQEELSILTSFRAHPLVHTSFQLAAVPLIVLGTGGTVPASVLVGYVVLSTLPHANVAWRFGPLRYVFASPVFHRWHHTAAEYGGERNFASTFPLLDLVFGTFYMPPRQLPEAYGVADRKFPPGFAAQLVYPFRQ